MTEIFAKEGCKLSRQMLFILCWKRR